MPRLIKFNHWLDDMYFKCRIIFQGIKMTENGIENVDEVLAWLREKGGYCDCEVLNVEEQFEFLK